MTITRPIHKNVVVDDESAIIDEQFLQDHGYKLAAVRRSVRSALGDGVTKEQVRAYVSLLLDQLHGDGSQVG